MAFKQENILFGISRKPQSSYQTEVVPSAANPTSHVQVLSSREQSSMTNTIELFDNADQATGQREPSETYIGRHGAEGQLSMDLDIRHAKRMHHAHFGATAFSTLAAASGGDPAVYQSLHTRLDPAVSDQLPAYELVKYLAGSSEDRRYPSMVSRELQITGVNEDEAKRMTIAQQWVGSGQSYSPSGLIWQPTAGYHVEKTTTPFYLAGIHAALKIGDYDGSGAGQNVVDYADCTLRRWNVTYANEFSPETLCPGAPLYKKQANGKLWKATTAFALNDVVIWQGRRYKVTTGGTTASTAPTHTTGTAADGTSALQYIGNGGIAFWIASSPVVLGEVLSHNDRIYTVTTAGTTDATGPTGTGSSVTDGTATLRFDQYKDLTGVVGGQLLLTGQSVAAEFTVDAKANSQFVRDMENQRKLDVVFGGLGRLIRAGHQYSMLHHLYLATYEAVEPTFINGILRYVLRTRAQLDQAQGKVVDVTIIETTPSTDYV